MIRKWRFGIRTLFRKSELNPESDRIEREIEFEIGNEIEIEIETEIRIGMATETVTVTENGIGNLMETETGEESWN